MNKKLTATLVVAAIIVAGVIGFLIYTMQKQKAESAQMLELAEMDKREMENEYEQFAMQYNEMKMQINNDFMTNADVPSLAFQGVIDHPVNPATGKEISVVPPSQKKASGITISHNWRPGSNNANTYRVPDEDWYTVSENIFDAKNWHKGIH